jgi:hypothetical protein
MKRWPLPLLRNHRTDAEVDAAVRRVLACPTVTVRQCDWPHSCVSVARCDIGELRFWSENACYAYANEGRFTPADGSPALVWKDVMPSRWAVRQLYLLASSPSNGVHVWREPQVPDVAAPAGCVAHGLAHPCEECAEESIAEQEHASAVASWTEAAGNMVAYWKKNGPTVEAQWCTHAAQLLSMGGVLLGSEQTPLAWAWLTARRKPHHTPMVPPHRKRVSREAPAS